MSDVQKNNSDHHRDVFVLSCDINRFSELDEATMNATVKVVFEVMENSLQMVRSEFPQHLVFHTFGGDGFMIAIGLDPAVGSRTMIAPFIALAADIHCIIRRRFLEIEATYIAKNAVGPSLRMGLNFGQAAYLIQADSTSLPVGTTLNDAQRIMDSASGWHIVASEALANLAGASSVRSKRDALTGTIFRELDFQHDSLRLRLTESPGWFTDKNGKRHSLWWIYGESVNQIGESSPPSKGPRHVKDRLDEAGVLNPIKSIIRRSTAFFSVTTMPPAIWLTDPTLTAVLLSQARQTKLRGGASTHQRLFVWDEPLPHAPQIKLLKRLHEIANVRALTLTRSALVSVVDAFRQKVAFIEGSRSAVAAEFISHPLREFWIANEKQEIASAGYGVDRDFDGSYEGVAELKSDVEKMIASCWKEFLLAASKEMK